jgi:hypothetical protein
MAQPALKHNSKVPPEAKTPRHRTTSEIKAFPERKTFHASVQVTRMEEWSVEARSAEEARELLEQGRGYRARVGDCIHFEIDKLTD